MATRGPYGKTALVKAEILAAALRIVTNHGYDATTIQRIADETGLTKAGVLHHFPTRETLLLEVLQNRDAADAEAASSDDPLIAYLRIAEHNMSVRGLVSLFVTVTALAATDATQTERREFMRERYRLMLDGLTEDVRREQEEGRVTDSLSAETIARLVVAVMDGMQLQWMLSKDVEMPAPLLALIELLRPRG